MNDHERPRLTQEEIEQIARDESIGRAPRRSHGPSDDDARRQYQSALRENAPYLTLGMQMALTIALGAGIGWWVDQSTGSTLWLGLGAGIGAVAGMGYFILIVLRMEGSAKKKHRRPNT